MEHPSPSKRMKRSEDGMNCEEFLLGIKEQSDCSGDFPHRLVVRSNKRCEDAKLPPQIRYFSGKSSGLFNRLEHSLPSYKTLESMLDDKVESRQITDRLSVNSSGFCRILKENKLNPGMLRMILRVLGKVCCEDESNTSLHKVLQDTLNQNFYLKIVDFMTHMLISSDFKEEEMIEAISNSLHLLQAWLTFAPNSSEISVAGLLPTVRYLVEKKAFDSRQDVNERLKEVEEMSAERGKCAEDKKCGMDRLHKEVPPDYFRNIPVIPTGKELNSFEYPFLRTNLTSGSYTSIEHYLDVQFRLLREDLVRPLREGIKGYFSTGLKKPLNVKIYENVSIGSGNINLKKGICYDLHFYINNLKFVNWRNSKRLQYGNLLCLSSDHFKNHFLFASVTGRDPKMLHQGIIQVEFFKTTDATESDKKEIFVTATDKGHCSLTTSCVISSGDKSKQYLMVESAAYFEAYRYVLSGLQQIHKVPLEKYLVYCQTSMSPPAYLRSEGDEIKYDFSSILSQKATHPRDHSTRMVEVLKVNDWPQPHDLDLDPSQLEALKCALTNDLALIQGPPGTGKTYVGLKIIKILLENKRSPYSWLDEDDSTLGVPKVPILLVCYTNHALDQFLEGIAAFHPSGLIRIGGRCITESLKKYLFRPSSSQNRDRKYLFKFLENVEIREFLSNNLSRNVVSMNLLETVIPPDILMQLQQQKERDDDEILLDWLGIKEKILPLPATSYVVTETLSKVVESLQKNEFHLHYILHAIICSGKLDKDPLTQWLRTHPYVGGLEKALPDSAVVYRHLHKMTLPFNSGHLTNKGFHDLEIKCAWFITGKSDQEELSRWMQSRRDGQVNSGVGDALFEKPSIQDERRSIDPEEDGEERTDCLEEQRMIDDGFTKKKPKNFFQRRFISIEDICTENVELSREELKFYEEIFASEIERWMTISDVMSSETATQDIPDVFALTLADRWGLYRYWVRDLIDDMQKTADTTEADNNAMLKRLEDDLNEQDLLELRRADVIAMTTTGAAKYRNLIHKLPTKIVIVEEAAEVLEAHIVTSMPRTTEHLILIGDHQQLRPSSTVYDLAKRYNLDVSLFERMIKSGLPYSKLTLQHRMRPRIADLLRPHIYEDLEDHQSVQEYDDIIGVHKNVFFLSHQQQEDDVKEGTTKANQYEADFMVALCKYLLQQGYQPQSITILTAYVGQIFAIKKAIASNVLKQIRVVAVDNFQGEENDIILLSLVRSNEEGRIGFLSIENRICVALSRAKKGFYCIGNFKMLKEKNEMWKTILNQLKSDGLIGETFPLQCKNHKEQVSQVKTMEDFQKVPEGGCGQPCECRLNCGHVCTRLCHPDDEDHELFRCRKPCEKSCESGHKCQRRCYEICPRCPVIVPKTKPGCGHVQKMPCYQHPRDFTCKFPCSYIIKKCGHEISGTCGIPPSYDCHVLVKVQMPCGHQSEKRCFESMSPNPIECEAKCTKILQCGHPCKGTCGECMQGRLHVRCRVKCERVLCCGHICRESCAMYCPPCSHKCQTSCRHSKCQRTCMEPCTVCREKCGWKCKHYQCGKLCSEPCDRPPCNQPCNKVLSCRHTCIGLCGEPCPKLCRICDQDEVTSIFFGDEDEPTARFVELEDCKHIFTHENLDRWMEQESTGDVSAIDIKLKECPRCKTPIRRSTRYGNIVNQQLKLMKEVKRRVAGSCKEIETMKVKILRRYRPFSWITLKIRKTRSLPRLNAIELELDSIGKLQSIGQQLLQLRDDHHSRDDSNLTNLFLGLQDEMTQTQEWISRDRSYFTEQERNDFKFQIHKFKFSLELIRMKKDPRIKKLIAEVSTSSSFSSLPSPTSPYCITVSPSDLSTFRSNSSFSSTCSSPTYFPVSPQYLHKPKSSLDTSALPSIIASTITPDSSNTSALPSITASTNAPDSSSTSALPSIIASSNAPDSSNTSALPSIIASTNTPDSSNTSALPSIIASTNTPDSSSTSALPSIIASSNAPDSSNTSALPSILASTKTPDSSSTSALPSIIASSNAPDSSSTSALPSIIASSNAPDSSNTSALPSIIASTNTPDSSSTSALPSIIASSNAPDSSNTSALPSIIASTSSIPDSSSCISVSSSCSSVSSTRDVPTPSSTTTVNAETSVEDAVRDCVTKAEGILFNALAPFDEAKVEEVNKMFKMIQELLPSLVISGLGITEGEREMIVKTVALKQGHWFKCKNGHIYCIGECGGAMQKSVCPECRETIGGEQHRLHEGNELADVMDGATHSAWDPNTFAIPEEVEIWANH